MLTEAQRRVLRKVAIDAASYPDGTWIDSDPPHNAVVVRNLESKGLVEVSSKGVRLTAAGRRALKEGE